MEQKKKKTICMVLHKNKNRVKNQPLYQGYLYFKAVRFQIACWEKNLNGEEKLNCILSPQKLIKKKEESDARNS